MKTIKEKLYHISLKKQIFISNTFMVLLSLLIFFGVCVGTISLFKDEILQFIGQNATLADNVYEVQNIFHHIDDYNNNWTQLSKDLKRYDYNLYVSDNDHDDIYSNIKHSEEESIDKIEKDKHSKNKVYLTNLEGITIVRLHNQYNIYATHYNREGTFKGIDRGVFEILILSFLAVGIIALVILVLSSQLLTKLLTRRILKPADMLTSGAKRVDEGNFKQPINYRYHDEFKEACDTFDVMQVHLQEGIDKNKAYEKARMEMISGISHDLRTPLTSIKGFIKGLIDGVASTPEKQQQYLHIAYDKACDMETLLQKFFFYSKVETGNLPTIKTTVSINEYMDDYVSHKQQELKTKNIDLIYTSKSTETLVSIDLSQIKRVFDNIIENSIRYASVDDLKINITLNTEKDHINIRFKDNGKGVEDDKLPRLFEQFYRGDTSRHDIDGSGLGLYVCEVIIQQHGGTIKAYNDQGLVIDIQLPIEKEPTT